MIEVPEHKGDFLTLVGLVAVFITFMISDSVNVSLMVITICAVIGYKLGKTSEDKANYIILGFMLVIAAGFIKMFLVG